MLIYDILILPYYKELSSKNSKLPNIISEVYIRRIKYDKTEIRYTLKSCTVNFINYITI